MQPFNITVLDPEEYIAKRQLLPVTVPTIFEPSTTYFHPNGLYSEAIFGQVGSTERIVKRGYIDLRTNVITPHLYKQLMTLKGYYEKIMRGSAYAYFDEELKDLVICPADHPGARTGFTFFTDSLKKIQFKQTDSIKRRDKIELIRKYFDRMLVSRFIVLPAGIRDVKIEDGKTSSEEINKYYAALLVLIKALPEKFSEDPLYDTIRFQIQLKIQEIYDYIANMVDGKGGFAQSKYAARGVTYGTRNVITACTVSSAPSSDSPQSTSVDEVQIPLFQAMKSAVPLVVNKLANVFFNSIFFTNDKVALINPDTYEMEYVSVSPSVLNTYSSAKGLEDLINEFQNKHWVSQPAAIPSKDKKKDYYLYLVYEHDNYLYTARSVTDLFNTLHRGGMNNAAPLEGLQNTDYMYVLHSALDIYSSRENMQSIYVALTEEAHARLSPTFIVKHDTLFDRDLPTLKLDNKECTITNSIMVECNTPVAKLFKDSVTMGDVRVQSIASVCDSVKLMPEMFSKKYQRVIHELEIESVDKLKGLVRPITWLELGYIATYAALRGKHSTATRYPILNFEGIVMNKIHLTTTQPSKTVILRHHGSEDGDGVLLPEYPDIHEAIKTSMSVHPATLDRYDGDHDGDTLSAITLLSNEANEELEDYLSKPISMVDGEGSLIYNLNDGRLVRYSLFSATYHPLPEKI